MPELRKDWLTGRSVLVAENRALRPNEFAIGGDDAASVDASPMQSVRRSLSTCPFCAGNEGQTPAAVYVKRDDQGNWLVRVVPNAFPAVNNLSGEARSVAPNDFGIQPPTALIPSNDLQSEQPILGAHEVIIESGLHFERMSELSRPHLREVIETYAGRLRHWRELAQLRYGLLFKNQGPRAGASVTHIHSQLIALPTVPLAVESELQRCDVYFAQNHRCAYCDIIAKERATNLRIVSDDDCYIAFCPFASLQPHEVWLMPIEHATSFELEPSESLDRLTSVLEKLLAQFEAIAPRAQYNLILRTAPWGSDYGARSHWRIEILPRVNSLAGLEIATGIYINPLPPERAASELRAAQVF